MTKPVYTDQYCSVCGTVVGKVPGINVVPGLLCNNPLCHVQTPVTIDHRRDQLLVFLADRGFAVTSLAKWAGISRQRVYQILNKEKSR